MFVFGTPLAKFTGNRSFIGNRSGIDLIPAGSTAEGIKQAGTSKSGQIGP